MDGLFPGVPEPVPVAPEAVLAPDGSVTFTVGPESAAPAEHRVRHADGYRAFVAFAAGFGVAASTLLDPWLFAHVVRAHHEAVDADPALERSAVVLLGNVLIAPHTDCAWADGVNGLRIGNELGDRLLFVSRTVRALLDADESRFREFRSVVERWCPDGPADQVGAGRQPLRPRPGPPRDR